MMMVPARKPCFVVCDGGLTNCRAKFFRLRCGYDYEDFPKEDKNENQNHFL